MKKLRLLLPLVVATSLFTTAVTAQTACSSPQHRAFDFWAGDWQVHTPDGKLAGHNRIEIQYGGCVVHEHYDTGRGYSGESLNIYDSSRQLWHQTWVDSSGLLLLLEGSLLNGEMVLQGQAKNAAGEPVTHKIVWTANADGSVRQHWQTQTGNGPWNTSFDGHYSKVPAN